MRCRRASSSAPPRRIEGGEENQVGSFAGLMARISIAWRTQALPASSSERTFQDRRHPRQISPSSLATPSTPTAPTLPHEALRWSSRPRPKSRRGCGPPSPVPSAELRWWHPVVADGEDASAKSAACRPAVPASLQPHHARRARIVARSNRPPPDVFRDWPRRRVSLEVTATVAFADDSAIPKAPHAERRNDRYQNQRTKNAGLFHKLAFPSDVHHAKASQPTPAPAHKMLFGSEVLHLYAEARFNRPITMHGPTWIAPRNAGGIQHPPKPDGVSWKCPKCGENR